MYIGISLGSIENNSSNLGTLYCEVVKVLKNKKYWNIKGLKKITGRFHLLLGEAQGSNINYKILSGYNSLYPGLYPLINYYRGFNLLCRKAMMSKTLKDYLKDHPFISFNSICPETYTFYPAKREESEREEFILSSTSSIDFNDSNLEKKIWILKPSDGCKGHSIKIMDNPQEVLEFIDNQSDGSIAWVVQRYLENPILIPQGNRKFDIRIWVLLDSSYQIHIYHQGVLRVTAKSYEPGNWTDLHSHLSNHCIAETHPDYGVYEPTNEIWFDEFELILLEMSNGKISFARDILPRIYNIIRLTLTSVREKWECTSESSYRSFAVFGYDFMLTKRQTNNSNLNLDSNIVDEVDVWLIEINSSPAVAEKLLPVFAKKLVEYAIDSVYPNDNDNDNDDDDNNEEEAEKEENDNENENDNKEEKNDNLSESQLFKEDFITITM